MRRNKDQDRSRPAPARMMICNERLAVFARSFCAGFDLVVVLVVIWLGDFLSSVLLLVAFQGQTIIALYFGCDPRQFNMSSTTVSSVSDKTSTSSVSDKTGTLVSVPKAPSGVTISCEHSVAMPTGVHRAALAFNLMPDVVNMRKIFSEVVISNVRAEVRQDALIGIESGHISAHGRIYVAVIPSGKNTDIASGKDASTIMQVRRKQAFPLSSVMQENKVLNFSLVGFELDLAQDPRRQQGPVAWVGNTGITAHVKGEQFSICSVTWYFDCVCSGVAANW